MEAELGSDVDEPAYSDDGAPDELDTISRRSGSPSKLTARQRAKGNKDLQESLLALPNEGQGKKAVILTEAERLQKREETARRRKRQSEQRLADEQEATVNRLLRAQTSRSRAKLDPSPLPAPGSGADSNPNSTSNSSTNANTLHLPSGGVDSDGHSRRPSPLRSAPPPRGDRVRYVSGLVDGSLVLRIGVPEGKEGWLGMGLGENGVDLEKVRAGKRSKVAVCAVKGCGERRKYRSVKDFEVGGCCMAHLKEVEAGL